MQGPFSELEQELGNPVHLDCVVGVLHYRSGADSSRGVVGDFNAVIETIILILLRFSPSNYFSVAVEYGLSSAFVDVGELPIPLSSEFFPPPLHLLLGGDLLDLRDGSFEARDIIEIHLFGVDEPGLLSVWVGAVSGLVLAVPRPPRLGLAPIGIPKRHVPRVVGRVVSGPQ